MILSQIFDIHCIINMNIIAFGQKLIAFEKNNFKLAYLNQYLFTYKTIQLNSRISNG